MHEQSNQDKDGRRSYRMRRRQASIDATRRRITAAAFELHSTLGPSRTTIRAIADRAGVQRHTVYAHFPEMQDLYRACTEHGMSVARMPSPEPWVAIGEPDARLRAGLAALYGWYRANRGMLLAILRDADPSTPAPTEPDPFEQRMAAIHRTLAAGWSPPTPGAIRVLEACIAHAIDFETWRSLTDGGLDNEQVAGLLTGLVAAVVRGEIDPG
jgi:AcrR family transcriptional regulator